MAGNGKLPDAPDFASGRGRLLRRAELARQHGTPAPAEPAAQPPAGRAPGEHANPLPAHAGPMPLPHQAGPMPLPGKPKE